MRFLFMWAMALLPLIALPQAQFKVFPEEDQAFIKDLKDFLKTADRDQARDFIDDWEKKYWPKEAVVFDADKKSYLIKVCNWMLKKRVKAFPEFKAFLMSMGAFQDGLKDDKSYQAWKQSMEKVMGAKTTTPFTNYVTMSENLLMRNVFYKSVTTTWKASSNRFSFVIDSVPKVVFETTDVSCQSIGDSLNIYATTGSYYPLSLTWYGKQGTVDWQRAKMDAKTVYATLKSYKIDCKTSGYSADSVVYQNPKYFDTALMGKLTDKVLADMQGDKAIYPQFDSYDKRFRIADIYPGVDYDGGFLVKGAKFIGSGNSENPATLNFKLNGKVFMKARALSYILRDERVSAERAAVTFYWESDSMYHPGLPFKYLKEKKEVTLIRDNTGFAQTPFFDSYHKLEMYFEELLWRTDQPRIDLKMIIGAAESSASFRSDRYFREDNFKRLQALADVNPLFKVRDYSNQMNSRELDIVGLAQFMGRAPSEIRPLLANMAVLGYVTWLEGQDRVEIKDKLFDNCLNRMGKKDYDVLEVNSNLSGDRVNASINLLNFDLKIFGIDRIFLSDSQNVNIKPIDGTILVKKNRDFFFAGLVNAGRFTFFGKEFSFEYDKFKINLTNTDSLRIKAQSKEIDPETGKPALVNVKTVVENLNGELLIDNPNNKSGVVNYAQYPILISKKDSYAYWDQKSVHRGVYKRAKTFFHLEPFTIDSLDNFTNEALTFKGEFESAGILPTLQENLTLQPDYSLGIDYDTPAEGLPMYGGKGTFLNKVNMSNKGLRGDGELRYVTSIFKSNELFLFPDSTIGVVNTFEEKPQGKPTEFPVATSTKNFINWLPYRDFMYIHERENPIVMYEGKAEFHGTLKLSPKRLVGSGNAEFYKAVLESSLMVFKERTFDSDTCNFNLKSLSDTSGMAFLSSNLKAHIDFDGKIGEFQSNGGGSFIKFPVNQYLCYMDNFKWFMEKENLELSAGDNSRASASGNDDLDLTGAEFISIHPDQDSLRFLSPKAKYDLRTNIIRCADVRYINTGDARVYPDSGKVVLYKKARMETLRNSTILANTTTKYHNMFNATVDIQGKKKYNGVADYWYTDASERKQLVHFDVVQTDNTGQTVASGIISDTVNFALSPAFDYKGSIRLAASNPDLFFKGNFRLTHACERLSKSWVSFEANLSPTDIYIPVDTGRIADIENRTVGAGLMLATDSLHVYSSVMNVKRAASDPEVLSSSGFIYFDSDEKEYRIGSKEKIKSIAFQGDYLALNTKSCMVTGEGKLRFLRNTGQVKVKSYGSFEHNLLNDTATFEAILALDFFFENACIKQMSETFEKSVSQEPVPFGRPIYERSLTELLGKKDADKLISQANLYGSYKKIPDELEHTLFFSHLRMKWNPSTKSFISVGKIGLGNINKNQLNKYYNGKVELVQKRSGEIINIYLVDDNNNWFFFNYANNQMQGLSSDEKWNTIIKELKPEKRQLENKEKGTAPYSFNISISSKVNSFLKKFTEE